MSREREIGKTRKQQFRGGGEGEETKARRERGDERAQRRKVTERGRCQGQVTIVMLARAMTPAMTQGRVRAGCADINCL